MLDCIITVKGNGVGKYGRSKKDRTGYVSEFCVDNTFFYRAIFKHLKECNKCDPNDVLKTLLFRRKDGLVTGSLAELAVKYKRNFQSTDWLLVEEYICRCIDSRVILKYLNNFEYEQIPNFYRKFHSFGPQRFSGLKMDRLDIESEQVFVFIKLYIQYCTVTTLPESNDELMELIKTSEVLES
jgi:hypothetical protein